MVCDSKYRFYPEGIEAIEQFPDGAAVRELTLGELLYQSVFSREIEPGWVCMCVHVYNIHTYIHIFI